MNTQPTAIEFSRRERQIMYVVYKRGHVTAADVQAELPDAPSYSAVRALLAILVNKGQLQIDADGPRYIYHPTQPLKKAGRMALRRVVETFFRGSVEHTVAALLDIQATKLSSIEIERLKSLIDQTRKAGR
jgi:predicted transcriptional regulator